MKFNKDILPNLAMFAVIVGVFGYIVFQSGAINDVKAGKFDKAVARVTSFAMGAVDKGAKQATKNLPNKKFGGNAISLIIPDVCYTFDDINIFKELFNTDKKVVFYVYTPQEEKTAQEIKKYINEYYSSVYIDKSMTKTRFIDRKSDVRTNNNGCSSIEECRKVQANSSRHTQISSFVEKCAKGVCIINNQTRHYVKISSKDVEKVKELLKKYSQE